MDIDISRHDGFRYFAVLLVCFSAPSFFAVPAFGQESGRGEALDEIVVTATRMRSSVRDVPRSVSLVGQERIQNATQQLALDEALAGVPGLYMQNRYNFSQDLSISLRGFGSRASFGIRGTIHQLATELADDRVAVGRLAGLERSLARGASQGRPGPGDDLPGAGRSGQDAGELAGGEPLTLDGVSVLTCEVDVADLHHPTRLIVAQRDYYDLSDMVLEHAPFIGIAARAVKRQLRDF